MNIPTKRIIPVLSLCLLIAVLCACGAAKQSSPTTTTEKKLAPTSTIPKGEAEWVFVERELPLEIIDAEHFVLPYGAGSTGRSLKRDATITDPKTVVRYQVVGVAHFNNQTERCDLALTSFQIVHLDNSTTNIPTSGYVVDNSDGQRGFRVELSIHNGKQLVIPARATATVYFDAPVPLLKQ